MERRRKASKCATTAATAAAAAASSMLPMISQLQFYVGSLDAQVALTWQPGSKASSSIVCCCGYFCSE